MNIRHKSDAIHVDKPEGSSIDYYIFPEYEIHYNEIKAGTVQHWHHHSLISESLYVIEGELETHWIDQNGEKQKQVVKKGDVIEVKDTPHTFMNASQKIVRVIAFRFVPIGEDQRERIKSDKVLHPELDK